VSTIASSRPQSRRHAAQPDDPFLIAKITKPALPGWVVPRPRIEKRIANGARGPLTVITGPPGAGKTVAMAWWAAANSAHGPTAWLMLDEFDNRPRVFWSYVIEALRDSGVAVPKALSTAARTGTADLGFILRLASAVAAQHAPVSLVLDDLHLVTSHTLMNGLVRLLRNAQPGLHLVVASRGDPALPLHGYRLAGELTEIRTDELAFTVAESDLLMAQHRVTLPQHALESLTARAEGWAAALRLAAISMNGHPDPEQSAKEIAAEDGAVAGYLVEEVLSAQPPRVQNLLLKTSILDRVRADIASDLAGDEQASAELPALAEANTFVQPLRNGWYRYHSLFAEVLRLKLSRQDPQGVPELHRRAARWFRRNGMLAEATRQAAEGGDWQLAARIAVDELAVGQLAEPEAIQPLAEVLRGMPQDRPWTQPHPWLVSAALRLADDGDDPGPPLAAAEALLRRVPENAEIPGRLAAATLRLGLARRTGDLPSAGAAADQAVALLGKLPADLLDRHPEVRTRALAGRGVVQSWSGDFQQAAVTLSNLVADAASPSQRADVLGKLALAEALSGRLTHAAELAGQAEDVLSERQLTLDNAGSAGLVALAYVHLERHELTEARRRLKHADVWLRARPDKLMGAVAGLVAAGGCLAEGRCREAREVAARAREGWSPPSWLERRLALLESQAWLAAGDTEAAAAAARRAGARTFLDATAALARARLASGDARAAREELAAGITEYEHSPERERLEARLAEAQLAYVGGDHDHVVRALGQALASAQREQLRLPIILERSWLRAVLERHQDLAQGFQQLVNPRPASRGPAHPAATAGPPGAAARPRATAGTRQGHVVVEKLSGREREVLRHVSELLETAEIAEEMYVSVNTVKSHLKSIFRKLGVASRNEAVRTARQLKLI
jgi:LuxR family transcriptional regulator, maltose regulon positive regulatory protein